MLTNIQEKIGKKEHEMGVYRPENNETGRPAMWLPFGKPLREFQFKPNETVYYKKRTRPLKYQLIDGTAKMVMIDDAATVEAITHKIGDHIGLKNYDEFGLRFPEDKSSWLDPLLTLQQLRVTSDRPLLFARRFFGETLDLADPFQLQLFYIEANKAILEDELPCTKEEAIKFAALQLQITFGNFDPKKHTKSWLDKTQFLPSHWQKEKKIESEIYKEYKKLVNLNPQQAKYRYYNEMRQMKSFGTTFFTCIMYYDEKKKKKKKNRPIKLGVSREDFIVLDLTTREPIHKWNFTWHKSFKQKTLPNGENLVLIDFGDHLPPQLLIKSPHADQICKLITGYIDLILKNPQDVVQSGLPDDFFHAVEETLETAAAFPTAGVVATNTAGYFRGPNNTVYHPPSQRINVSNVTSAQRACCLLSDELGTTRGFTWVNPSELTLENAKIQFNSDKRAFASAMDDLLGTAKFNPAALRKRDIDLKAQQLTAQVKGIAARARAVAAFDLDATSSFGARAIAQCSANLFRDLDNATSRVDSGPPGPDFLYGLEQAEKAIHRAQLLLEERKKEYIVDEGSTLMMLDFVKEMDLSFQHMMALSQQTASPQAKVEIDNAISHCKTGKEWLLGSLSQLLPVINDPAIRDVATEIFQDIEALANQFVEISKKGGVDMKSLQPSRDAITDFSHEIFAAADIKDSKALDCIVDFATPATLLACTLSDLRTALTEPEKLLNTSKPEIVPGPNVVEVGKLNNFLNDEINRLKQTPPEDYENQMNSLREAVAKQAVSPTALRSDPLSLLVTNCSTALDSMCLSIDTVIDGVDQSVNERLKKAKTNLKDNMTNLQALTENLRDDPNSSVYREKVTNALSRLEGLTQQMVTDAGELSAQTDLRFNAKVALAKAKGLMVQATRCDAFVTNPAIKEEMQNNFKNVRTMIPNFLPVIQNASSKADSLAAQTELLRHSQNLLSGFEKMVDICTKFSTQVNNDVFKDSLKDSILTMKEANKAFSKSCIAVSAIEGESKIEVAIEDIEATKVDLDTAEFAASQGLLKPVPGQTSDEAMDILVGTSSSLTKNLEDLIESTKKGEPITKYATTIQKCAKDMGTLAKGTRMLASNVVSRDQQRAIILKGKEVNDKAASVISIARVIASQPEYRANKKKLAHLDHSHEDYKSSIEQLLAGMELDHGTAIDDAVMAISKALNDMKRPGEPNKNLKPNEATNNLVSDAKALSAAVAQFSAVAQKNPLALGSAAKTLGLTTAQLIGSCVEASNFQEKSKDAILQNTQKLAEYSQALLTNSKVVVADKSKQSLDKFKTCEVEVKDSISELLKSVGVFSAQTEEAISAINGCLALLNEEEGEDVQVTTIPELYLSFSNGFKEIASVSSELAKASGSNSSSFPISVLAKEALGAVESVIEPTRIASKMAHKLTPVEAKMLKEVRLIQEDPVNAKEVLALTKSICVSADNLNQNVEKLKTTNTKDNRLPAIIQTQGQLKSAIQQLQLVAKAQGAERNIGMIVEAAKLVGQKTKALALLTKDKPLSDDILTTQFADQLKEATKALGIAITGQVRAASAVITYEDSQSTSIELARATKTITDTLNDLALITSALSALAASSEEAANTTRKSAMQIESESISLAVDGRFSSTPAKGPNDKKNFIKSVKDLVEELQKMVQFAKQRDIDSAVIEVKKINSGMKNWGNLSVANAAGLAEKEDQANMLELSKNFADNYAKLLLAIKTLNVYDEKAIAKVDKLLANVNEIAGDLLNELQSGTQVVAECESAVVTIKAHLNKISANTKNSNPKTYAQCRSDLTNTSKTLLAQGRNLLITDKTKGGEVGMILLSTIEATDKFVGAVNNTLAVIEEDNTKTMLKTVANKALVNLNDMISLTAQSLQGQEVDDNLNAKFKTLNVLMAEVASAARKGDVAENALEQASKVIQESIQSINSTILYAQTGTIQVDDPKQKKMSRSDIQTKLLSTTKLLQKDVSTLLQATTDSSFAEQTQKIAKDSSQFCNYASLSAASEEDSMLALDFLNVAKELASKMGKILSSAKESRDNPEDGTKKKILGSIEEGFYQTLSEVNESTSRGQGSGMMKVEKELEIAKQSILSLLNDIPSYDRVVAEDLIKSSRDLMLATGQLRLAATQDEMIEFGKQSASATEKLVKVANTISLKLAPDPTTAQKILDATKSSANAMVGFLEVSKLNRQDPQNVTSIEQSSEVVTTCIGNLLGLLKLLPNTAELQVEGEDLEKKALEELNKCSEAITKSKEALTSSQSKSQTEEDSIVREINGALLTATSAITEATQKLVSTAQNAQSDRCQSTNKRLIKYNTDPAWANGLINASGQVSSSIQHLVQSASDCIEGKGQEALVAATQNVAQATTYLVQATKAKSLNNPALADKLNGAAKLVADATSKLIEASNKASQFQITKGGNLDDLGASDDSRVQELEQQMKIFKLENELEKAKRQLARLKKRPNQTLK
eukprot:TRINITY_DN11131_c0_g1_i1.p1 TRINITY_DN11131_c0_g1~~TRINITY_DN11131_c0_g1_i1.p1  ORF type:complete len:2488 (-),score=619.84 TRINITY_DN11131_c0_g1_i1:27-7406(-)